MATINYEKKDKIYSIKSNKINSKWINRILLIIFTCISLCLILVLFNFMSYTEHKSIKYSEKGNTSYTVYLKENNYYQEKFLRDDIESILSDLINTINVKFNYKILSTKELNYKYKYNIIGTLNIYNKKDNKKMFSKDYNFVSNKMFEISDNSFFINDDLDIDYDLYTSYASNFSKDFGVDVSSFLDIKMQVDVDGEYNDNHKVIDSINDFSISIPLSVDRTSIVVNNDNLDISKIFEYDEVVTNIDLIIYISICLGILFVGIIICIVRSINFSRNPYLRALNKIFSEYDSQIINGVDSYKESDNVVRVEEFSSLIDFRNKENSPIIFYEVEPLKKAYFIVIGKDKTYRYTLTYAYQIKNDEEEFVSKIKEKSSKDEDII